MVELIKIVNEYPWTSFLVFLMLYVLTQSILAIVTVFFNLKNKNNE